MSPTNALLAAEAKALIHWPDMSAEALAKEKASGAHGERIWSWRFDPKGSAGALQVADFAAYETTKQLVRTIGAEERRIRQSMDRLLERVTYRAEYFNARSLREIFESTKNSRSVSHATA